MHCEICDWSPSLDKGMGRKVKYDNRHKQWICTKCIEESKVTFEDEEKEGIEIQATLP